MQTKETLQLEGMSCGHCVRAVEDTLTNLTGVSVESVAMGSATISYDAEAVPRATIEEALSEEGYPVV